MIALIECHMDAGRKSDAAHIAQVGSHCSVNDKLFDEPEFLLDILSEDPGA